MMIVDTRPGSIMNEMIKRVSEAIHAALTTADFEASHMTDTQLKAAALAAIEAMREPTDEMKAAVENDMSIQGGLDDCNQHDIPDEVWRLMIKAAIDEMTPNEPANIIRHEA